MWFIDLWEPKKKMVLFSKWTVLYKEEEAEWKIIVKIFLSEKW